MGFDLTAFEPTDEEYSYFYNNGWWWDPLWKFVCRVAGPQSKSPVLTEEDARLGNYNDGHIIPRDKAKALGQRLIQTLRDGFARKYLQEREDYLSSLPDIICLACEGKGKVGLENEVVSDCNYCNGTGYDWLAEKAFMFSLENVDRFARFCIMSGGFDIW